MKLAEALALAPMRRKRRRHDEDDLQTAEITWLRTVLDPRLYIVAHVPNGGSRNAREAARLKEMGTLAGVFDVFILGPRGATWWIENKALNGELSEPQRVMLAFMIAQGVPHVIARSLADVEKAVDAWGLKTRIARAA